MSKKRSRENKSLHGRANNLVVGVNACNELLLHAPGRVLEVFIENEKAHPALVQNARSGNIAVHVLERRKLSELVEGVSHQGVIARVSERSYQELPAIIERLNDAETALIVAVDELYDPQNLGSILRASECFGADAVMWSRNRGVSITPAVTKVSAGASELLSLCPVSNLRNALGELKKSGFWVCVAAVGSEAQSIHEVELPGKVVLVLGSEGKGVQPLIQKEADLLLKIPMFGRIDSLNVSQAAAVFLAAYRSQIGKTPS